MEKIFLHVKKYTKEVRLQSVSPQSAGGPAFCRLLHAGSSAVLRPAVFRCRLLKKAEKRSCFRRRALSDSDFLCLSLSVLFFRFSGLFPTFPVFPVFFRTLFLRAGIYFFSGFLVGKAFSFSNFSATSFRYFRIGRCCGQASSHRPQPIQSPALLPAPSDMLL